MQDQPNPEELVGVVARLLRETVMPQLSGHTAFMVRVAANALDVAGRQILLQPQADAAEQERLAAMLGRGGDLEVLNRLLCSRIDAGEITLETPGLTEHLWATTLAKLAVDQPAYAAYARELNRT